MGALAFTASFDCDPPMLPDWFAGIPPDQEIAGVTADGAVDTRKCHDAIDARGAERMDRLEQRRNKDAARDFDRQGADLRVCISVLNGLTARHARH